MATRNSDFPQIQQRLRALGFYPPAPYPVDDIWGAGMQSGIAKLLDQADRAANIEPPKAPRWPLLPTAYFWLRRESFLPPHLVAALDLLGTKEVPGAGDNPEIMEWASELNAAGHPINGYSTDSVPWCGLFIAICMLRAKEPIVDGPLWARNWSSWGNKSATPKLGDVLTFRRQVGGHVAFYIGEDNSGYFHILGGNQSDSVSIMRIAKSRMLAARDLDYGADGKSLSPVILAPNGTISSNEA